MDKSTSGRIEDRGSPGAAPSAARPLTGRIRVPGDKSITHRALILSALADGSSVVTGANLGADVRATAAALAALGASCHLDEANYKVVVEGSGWAGLGRAEGILDAGNSGTTLRLLLGVCAATPGRHVLTGDDSLRSRPMLRVVEPLRRMGAVIEGRRGGDLAPLVVQGGALAGVAAELTVASAQAKSALLLAGLRARGVTSVTEPAPSRDHTERMLGAAGVAVERQGTTVTVAGGQQPEHRSWPVPGDLSSAAFFIAGAVIVPGSDLEVEGVGLNPTRSGVLEVLRTMGADLEVHQDEVASGEPRGSVRARHSRLVGTEVGPAGIAAVIDELPVLAVVATQAEGRTVISGASELRVKESDRIATLASNLRALGADVEELRDGLIVSGPTSLRGGRVETKGDHRMALAMATAGLIASGEVEVDDRSCIATSFPEFPAVLATAQGRR
jgi:3-phosphoshikimate 1-carboxyvinyltransferase